MAAPLDLRGVACVCGSATMDPAMVRCSYCSRLEHAACYRLLEALPVLHCCLGCSRAGGRACTDTKLPLLAERRPDSLASTLFF